MGISFRDWLGQGEQIYSEAMREYQTLESQIEQLEVKLVEKKQEVNQIAQMIGKPPVESTKRLAAELIERHDSPIGAVTRALTGRGVPVR